MNELQPQKSNDSCLDRGQLVSLRDGELTPEETAQALAHLALCQDCASDERSMRTASQEVYDLLNVLSPSPQEIPETKLALSALQARLEAHHLHEKSRTTVPSGAHNKMSFFQARKPQHPIRWWIVVAAAALIALVVVPNAGALANQFLALFSVQQFQPVSIDPQTFRNGVGEDLQNFGDVNINSGNHDGIQNPTQAQVEQSLNFKLLLPGHLPPGVGHAMQFSLISSANGTFTFNAAKARTYLAQTGQSNVVIPSQLDGATFTITLTPGVIINYGDQCQGQNQCSGGIQFYIAEIPSPVIQATGKASLKDLRDFALSLPKLAPEARLLLQDINLNSGVVPLPIPPQVQAQQVVIYGVQGVLMTDTSLSLGALIWQTHGIIYAVGGATSDSAQLLDCANSLH
ncbi:MAG TPA: zf-HC2 domain-containing protein [Ktedonobacteraceae bacterium]|nr:zf-HC2 domain-containing protein [Ktedonobacteraceae bacterium]